MISERPWPPTLQGYWCPFQPQVEQDTSSSKPGLWIRDSEVVYESNNCALQPQFLLQNGQTANTTRGKTGTSSERGRKLSPWANDFKWWFCSCYFDPHHSHLLQHLSLSKQLVLAVAFQEHLPLIRCFNLQGSFFQNPHPLGGTSGVEITLHFSCWKNTRFWDPDFGWCTPPFSNSLGSPHPAFRLLHRGVELLGRSQLPSGPAVPTFYGKGKPWTHHDALPKMRSFWAVPISTFHRNWLCCPHSIFSAVFDHSQVASELWRRDFSVPWLPCWKTGTSDLSSKFCSKVLARSQFEATYIYIYIYSQLAITSSTEQLHLTVSPYCVMDDEWIWSTCPLKLHWASKAVRLLVPMPTLKRKIPRIQRVFMDSPIHHPIFQFLMMSFYHSRCDKRPVNWWIVRIKQHSSRKQPIPP